MTAQAKNTIAIVSVIVVLAITGLVVFLVVKKKKETTPSPAPAPSGGGSTGGGNSSGSSSGFYLGLGSTGSQVKVLQQKMNDILGLVSTSTLAANWVDFPLSTDGNWGPKTQKAFEFLSQYVGPKKTSIASLAEYNQIINALINYRNLLG